MEKLHANNSTIITRGFGLLKAISKRVQNSVQNVLHPPKKRTAAIMPAMESLEVRLLLSATQLQMSDATIVTEHCAMEAPNENHADMTVCQNTIPVIQKKIDVFSKANETAKEVVYTIPNTASNELLNKKAYRSTPSTPMRSWLAAIAHTHPSSGAMLQSHQIDVIPSAPKTNDEIPGQNAPSEDLPANQKIQNKDVPKVPENSTPNIPNQNPPTVDCANSAPEIESIDMLFSDTSFDISNM